MKEMGTYERVRLARYLATAVLYYHATPWVRKHGQVTTSISSMIMMPLFSKNASVSRI
jgi:hypothetical protein